MGNVTPTVTIPENVIKLIEIAQTTLSYKEIATDALNAENAVALVDALMAMGDISGESEAFKGLFNALKTACIKNAGDYCYDLGNAYSDKEEWDKSLVEFRKCMWLEPEKPAYMYKVARSIYKIKGANTEESLMLFNKILEIAPDSVYAEYAGAYLR